MFGDKLIYFLLMLRHFPNAKTKENLHVTAIVPYLFIKDKLCFKSAINAAIELINKDDRILKDYKLIIDFEDAATQLGFELQQFYGTISTLPVKQLILGPAFSGTIKAVSDITSYYNIPQIAYGNSANLVQQDLLWKKEEKVDRMLKPYPFLLRTTTSVNLFLVAKIEMFKKFGWKRIAILYENSEAEYFQAANSLASLAQKNGITVLSMQGFYFLSSDIKEQVDLLQKQDARIIVTFLELEGARSLFCEVYKRKMYSAKYQWIIYQGLLMNWYENVRFHELQNCTLQNYLEVADRIIRVAKSPLRLDGRKTIANLTSSEVWNLIKTYKDNEWKKYYIRKWKNGTIPNIPVSEYYEDSTFAFDAAFLAALALDKVNNKKGIKGCNNGTKLSVMDLLNCYKQDSNTSLNLIEAILDTEFEGVTGHVSFNKITEVRRGEVVIQQFKATDNFTKGNYTSVGFLNEIENKLEFHDTTGQSLFLNGEIIKDGVQIVVTPRTYNMVLTIIMLVFAAIGLLLSTCFLTINVYHRKLRLIKMSSPNINNGIILGCILCYVSVIVYGLDSKWIHHTKIPYVCNAVILTLSIGFTLSFGCLFAKTWRVYKIFTAAKTMKRVIIKDTQLYGIILLLIGIDVLIATLWITLSPFRIEPLELESNIVNGVVNQFVYYRCSCKHQLPFMSAMYAYKGILLIFGIFIAWETRKVKIAVLNDSQYIGMAVYNVCIVSAAGVVSTTALYSTEFYSSGYILVTLSIFICTTGTLLLIFVPKIIMLMGSSRSNKKSINSNMTSSISYKSSVAVVAN